MMQPQRCYEFKVDGCGKLVYKDSQGNIRNRLNGWRHVCTGEDVVQGVVSLSSVLQRVAPAPASDYFRNITPTKCEGFSCEAWVYQNKDYPGTWYGYNTGVAHTCTTGQLKLTTIPSFAKERTMNNNVKVISTPARGISASSLSIGEYGRIVGNHSHVGDVVLKAGTLVVNLSTPSIVWDSPFSAPFVERLKTGDKVEITVGFTPEFEECIRNEAQRGNKIMAIKSVREATNWGLKEAKDYVEALLLKF
jgi:hypothetical protein